MHVTTALLAAALAAAQDLVTPFTEIFVDDRVIEIVAEDPTQDLYETGAEACRQLYIDENEGTLRDGRRKCATLVADELADSYFCNATARRLSGDPTKSFRFYHGTYYFDSEEYELIRELLLRQGFVECLSGERVADEDFIWLLGHFDAEQPFYGLLRPGQVSNAMPNPRGAASHRSVLIPRRAPSGSVLLSKVGGDDASAPPRAEGRSASTHEAQAIRGQQGQNVPAAG